MILKIKCEMQNAKMLKRRVVIVLATFRIDCISNNVAKAWAQQIKCCHAMTVQHKHEQQPQSKTTFMRQLWQRQLNS